MSELNMKERFLKALKGEKVDKVPVLSVTQTAIVELMDKTGAAWPEAHSDAKLMAELAYASYEVCGLEGVRAPYCLTVLAQVMGCEINMGTKNRQPSVTAHPYNDTANLKIPENLLAQGRIPAVLEALKILKEKTGGNVPVIAGMEGPITLASDLCGVKKFMKWSIKDKDSYNAILDFATDACIEYANALADAGADVISVPDPVCSPDLMPPAGFEADLKPRLQKFAAAVKVPMILHICGDVTAIIPAMADCGFTSISIEEKVKDLAGAKAKVEGKVTICGNVSSPFVLLAGTQDAVKEAATVALEAGVDVLAPGCGIAPDTPVANLKALVAARDEFYK
ncbi:methylcobamide:CoM methyltransferase MtaA [Methanomethylovorans sp.]|uniref:methylcobamide:CoM methyltransferase MtaA n=1 Tax=Methanomethylovorans sp. TaxID=2758717 RepID=UPI000AB983A2|nr:methylcobamide:CoM methyltransferase MtaA [Methanomethylovorans sp.]